VQAQALQAQHTQQDQGAQQAARSCVPGGMGLISSLAYPLSQTCAPVAWVDPLRLVHLSRGWTPWCRVGGPLSRGWTPWCRVGGPLCRVGGPLSHGGPLCRVGGPLSRGWTPLSRGWNPVAWVALCRVGGPLCRVGGILSRGWTLSDLSTCRVGGPLFTWVWAPGGQCG
jgi:hypothetical protein